MAERIIELDAGTYDIRGDATSQVTVPVLTAGSINQASPTIGDTLTVSGSNVSGGVTTAYQWQQSADGSTGWANIAAATGASLDTSSGVTAGYHLRRGVSDGVQGPVYTATVRMAVLTATLSGASAANRAGDVDWSVTTNEASGTIYAALRLASDPQLAASAIINGTGGAIVTSTDATPTADGSNGGTFTAPGNGSYAVDIVQVMSGTSNVVSSGTVVVGEDAAELTITDFDEVNDTLDLASSKVGTCYYGIYPGGTVAGDITIANMIAGTDTGLVASGPAGVFVTAGVLDDVEIDDSMLTEATGYEIAFVVDINDGGTYTNLALQSFGTNAKAVATPLALTRTADDTTQKGNGSKTVFNYTLDIGGPGEVFVGVFCYDRGTLDARINSGGSLVAAGKRYASGGKGVSMAIYRDTVASGTKITFDVSFHYAPPSGAPIRVVAYRADNFTSVVNSFAANDVDFDSGLSVGRFNVADDDAVLVFAGEDGGGTIALTGATPDVPVFDISSADECVAGSADGLGANAAYAVGANSAGGDVSVIALHLR